MKWQVYKSFTDEFNCRWIFEINKYKMLCVNWKTILLLLLYYTRIVLYHWLGIIIHDLIITWHYRECRDINECSRFLSPVRIPHLRLSCLSCLWRHNRSLSYLNQSDASNARSSFMTSQSFIILINEQNRLVVISRGTRHCRLRSLVGRRFVAYTHSKLLETHVSKLISIIICHVIIRQTVSVSDMQQSPSSVLSLTDTMTNQFVSLQ